MICTLKSASWQAGEQLCCQGPGSLGGHSVGQHVLPVRKANNFLGCGSSSSSTYQGKWCTASAMHVLDHSYRAVSRFGLPGKMMSEFSRGSSGWLGAACPGRRSWGSCACSAGEAGISGDPYSSSLSTPLGGYGKEPSSSQCCMLGWQWAQAGTTEVQNRYKEKAFSMRAVKQQKRLPREAVLPPSSEVCKAQLSVPVQPHSWSWLEKEVELEISCASFQSKFSCHAINLTDFCSQILLYTFYW